MNLTRVLHQQFMQLRWHLLACVGVIMVLPVEETIVNMRDAQGHYQSGIATGVLVIAPLLAALIACANVQADLDEKRDLFWRSKPVRVGAFITTKFIVGLLLALTVLLVPVVFIWAMAVIFDETLPFPGYYPYVGNLFLISLLTYSVSFLCNVLVRKTARAWLIGITLTCFVLLLPFILSLKFTDVATDIQRNITKTYLFLTVGAALLGFVLANVAAQRNWHVQTNLKRLLWAGAGVVFALTFMGARQVANIQVLDQKAIALGPGVAVPGIGEIIQVDGRIISGGFKVDKGNVIPHPIAIRTENDRILCEEVPNTLIAFNRPRWRTLYHAHERLLDADDPNTETDVHPASGWQAGTPLRVGDKTFLLALFADYHKDKIVKDSGATDSVRRYERLTLRCFKSRPFFTRLSKDQSMESISSLDLSETLSNPNRPRIAMRTFGERLAVAVNNRVMEIQVTEQGELSLQGNGRFNYLVQTQSNEFTIPLVPLENLSIRNRIQLSIDLVFWPALEHRYRSTGFDRFSLVDIDADPIRFAVLDRNRHQGSIRCYEVESWDEEGISCRLHSRRPFTILEDFSWHNPHFVKDGRLYAYGWDKLMVFDLRSERGVRKLGHFQRLQHDYHISDVFVEENGNILLFRKRYQRLRSDDPETIVDTKDIYLLKGPRS